MMKTTLRRLLALPIVNLPLRFLARKFIHSTQHLSRTMMRYIQVSGRIPVNINNDSFILWSKGDDSLTSKLYYKIQWERDILSWYKAFAARCTSVVDAGANIGIFSLVAARANAKTIVHAFEPNPWNHARLKMNVALNELQDRIAVHQCALGNTTQNLLFYLPEDERVSDVSSVYLSHAKAFNDFKHTEIEVPCTMLDHFCEAQKFSPALIKVDVELGELQLLQGMERLLEKARPVLFCEIFYDVIKRKLNPALDSELPQNYTLHVEELLDRMQYHAYLIMPEGILHVDKLRFSPVSSMYMLLPTRLNQPFYEVGETDLVLKELGL